MFTRRTFLQAAAGIAVLSASGTAALADWKEQYPELVIAAVPDENATGTEKRYEPFIQYLSKQLGVPVKLRIANDYAAVVEGQIAGNIHVAQHGPASYARAFLNGAKIEPFGIQVNADGTKGYYSVMWVKADSPYQKFEDVKGKALGLVDPNSMSGNNVPRFAMNKMGIKPEEYFSNVVYAGSHENAIIALQQGQVDAAFNWWNDENESMLRRMERKNMAKYGDFRMIFKSDMIVNSPVTYLSDLPDDMKAAIRDAFFNVEKSDPEAFNVLTDGKAKPWEATSHKDYEVVVDLVKFVDTLRKQ
jgi:phosphonate transport system substrate-binding protein